MDRTLLLHKWHAFRQKISLWTEQFLIQVNTRRDFLVIFVIALCLGASVKMLARDTVTIGYSDYTLPRDTAIVNLNLLEKELIRNGGSRISKEPVPTGEVCSDTRE